MNDFWHGLGWFFVWLGLCLGIGGCVYLDGKNRADMAIAAEQTKQLTIQLEIERVKNRNE